MQIFQSCQHEQQVFASPICWSNMQKVLLSTASQVNLGKRTRDAIRLISYFFNNWLAYNFALAASAWSTEKWCELRMIIVGASPRQNMRYVNWSKCLWVVNNRRGRVPQFHLLAMQEKSDNLWSSTSQQTSSETKIITVKKRRENCYLIVFITTRTITLLTKRRP